MDTPTKPELQEMNRIQAHLVRRSFEFFRPCGPAMIARVVRGLSDDAPDVRAMLPEETAALHGKWFATLAQVVRHCDEFRKIEKSLGELGRRAAAAGATPADYRSVRNELLRAMAELAGEDWTDDLRKSWALLLDGASGAMMAGANATNRAA